MIIYAAGSVYDIHVISADLCGLTWSGNLLWFADATEQRIVAIDIVTGTTERELAAPGLRIGLAMYHDRLVYAAGSDYRLVMLDAVSGEEMMSARNPRMGCQITGMEGGNRGLWLGYDGRLELRAPGDLSLLSRIEVPGRVSGIAVTERYLVYSDREGELLTLVDPLLEAVVVSINIHGKPEGLAWDGRRIWHCESKYARIRAIDIPGIVPAA